MRIARESAQCGSGPLPSVTKAWTDAGFTDAVTAHSTGLSINVEGVQRNPHTLGLTPPPKRWNAEQGLRHADAAPPTGPPRHERIGGLCY
jgi:hypothetical protein